ncbi:hypothetical protein F444_13555 [Phytophthora nicotianae P1976]|uniref:Uncharacterized protein n=1 Tax=Phytophthora nicotianae P1976 TaxID=1317066 RepID=A0A080ZTH0_PHYNI|nr:hypothetical protein F444_13555 [Phytophthora nicotianae P1976]
MTDRIATENPGLPEGALWEQLRAAFYGPDREKLLEVLTEEQVLGRIRCVRRRYYGSDIHGVVEVPPCSLVKDSAIPFFLFHLVTAHSDPKEPSNRILAWDRPALKGLISSVRHQASNLDVMGSLFFFFRFKQALHRRMRNKRIMKEEASIAIEPGVPDILTVIDLGLVDPKGIAWVKHDINNDALLKGMCTYVSNGGASGFTSEKRDSSDTSSRSGMFGIANPVVVRTNNPLEMFNRELSAAFKHHTNLRQYVATIARMSPVYAQRQSSITRGLRRKNSALHAFSSRQRQT